MESEKEVVKEEKLSWWENLMMWVMTITLGFLMLITVVMFVMLVMMLTSIK